MCARHRKVAGRASCQHPCTPESDDKMLAPCQQHVGANRMSTQSSDEIQLGQVISMSGQMDAYKLSLNVAGIKQSDLQVSTDAGYLKVEGKTCAGTAVYTVDRLYQFPKDAHLDLATAVHSDGVLSFNIPKVVATEGRSIAIGTDQDEKGVASTAKATTPKVASETPVLSEVEANDANVQIPEESVDEFTMEGDGDAALPPHPMPTPTHSIQEVGELHAVRNEDLANQEQDHIEHPETSDWDELLSDLEEMGFADRKSNEAALEKHSGSIKLAVKDLVQSSA